ncbi:MAG: hypothetical protein JXA69_10730 [Phycisphaerae bacterium]|nr:hypothetical protein [Phycisphaerae bacterium]
MEENSPFNLGVVHSRTLDIPYVMSLATTPDGKHLLCGNNGVPHSAVSMLALSDWTCVHTWELGSHGNVEAVAVTPDGRYALAGCRRDGILTAWDLATRKLAWQVEGHRGAVTGIAVTPDDGVVSAGKDETLAIWNPSTGECLARSTKASAIAERLGLRLFGLSFQHDTVLATPDGRFALTCGGTFQHGWIYIWGLPSLDYVGQLDGHSQGVEDLAITPDGRRVVSSGYDGTVRVWDFPSRGCVRTIGAHESNTYAVCITRDGRFAISAGKSSDGIQVWDLSSGARVDCLYLSDNSPLLLMAEDRLLMASRHVCKLDWG